MNESQKMLEAIIAYKLETDGISPSLAELAAGFDIAKSQVQEQINRLVASRRLFRTPGKSRNLAVIGGKWRWIEPKPYPSKRVGDVLKVIIEYKEAYNGNAPSHREIADRLGLSYTGDIKGYVDELTDMGYLVVTYATDRHILVVGGAWSCDEEALIQANPNIYYQSSLFPMEEASSQDRGDAA